MYCNALICLNLNYTVGLTGGQKKKHPREHEQNLQASLDKSYEFYFCLNIITNLFFKEEV